MQVIPEAWLYGPSLVLGTAIAHQYRTQPAAPLIRTWNVRLNPTPVQSISTHPRAVLGPEVETLSQEGL